MPWSVLYGMLLAVVLMLTWGSRNHVIQKLGFLMAVSWALSNLCVVWLGFATAPVLVPSINAAVAVVIGALGFRNRNYTCLAIFFLFALELAITALAFAERYNGQFIHYAALNVVFVLRMFVVGGSAVRDMASGVRGEHSRAGYRRVGR